MNTHTRRENCPAETSRVWLQCGRHIFTGAYYKLIVWLMDLYLLAASVISAPNLRRHLTHSPARWRCELCTNCAYRLIFWNLQTIHSCRSSSSSSHALTSLTNGCFYRGRTNAGGHSRSAHYHADQSWAGKRPARAGKRIPGPVVQSDNLHHKSLVPEPRHRHDVWHPTPICRIGSPGR